MKHQDATRASRGTLATLGLHRPELRAWAMYDWAISALHTTIMVAVFPIYFTTVAGGGLAPGVATQYLALANSIEIGMVALLSPILGAIADYAARKKRYLALFTTLGVLGSASLYFVHHGDVVLGTSIFILTMIGAGGAQVFYESLLTHVAREEELDRVSSAGYALGYIGGGMLLALNLAWIQNPGWFGLPSGDDLSPAAATLPARLAFVSVAVWWAVFSIPLFLRVAEPPRLLERDEDRGLSPVRVGFRRVRETLRELKQYRQALLMLIAFLIYSDGIGTIQRMATAYGTELGIERGALILAILIVQFVGIPFAFLFGYLGGRIGTKRGIFIGLGVYVIASVFGYFMRTATHFYMLAGMVGMVQGGTQALSRSLFASMVPRHKAGEFFGFFGVFSKFAGMFGPLFFAAAVEIFGSGRVGILSIVLFFVAGGIVLAMVDPEEGAAAARAAERSHGVQPAYR